MHKYYSIQNMRARCIPILLFYALIGSFLSYVRSLAVERAMQKPIVRRNVHMLHPAAIATIAAPSSAAATIAISSSSQAALVGSLGYVVGLGAIAIYSPLLLKVLQKRDIEGLSIATWAYNLLGSTLSIAYPLKKGFPLLSYMELIITWSQCLLILGLLCQHHGKGLEFLLGVTVLAASFTAFIKAQLISIQALNAIQIAAILASNYANVPQILMTFQQKKASWSGITALLGMAGCAIRIFTTMQLTQDLLLTAGYALGFATNGVLLAQVIMYRGVK